MPTVFIFSATALLGILAPHTFSTNSTWGEKKSSAGPHIFSTSSAEAEENKNSAGPHTFSTNSTEEENKNSTGPLLWRGGEGENGCSAIH